MSLFSKFVNNGQNQKSYRQKIQDLKNDVNLDNEKLIDSLYIYYRKQWIWRISIWSIIIIALFILTVIATTIFEIRTIIISINVKSMADIKDVTDAIKNVGSMWHIYLISLVSLTSLLSFFIYINRQTWVEEKKDNNVDNGYNLVDGMPIVSKLSEAIKTIADSAIAITNSNKPKG